MDFLGYAALGGIERLTIVAGAVIIGYWGYRLYVAEKSAGLVFMGLAVLVLVGALATGGSYVRSVGEGYQLASLPSGTPGTEAAEVADTGSPFVENAETMPAVPAEPAAEPAATEADPAEIVVAEPELPAIAETAAPTADVTAAEEAVADQGAAPSPVRIATGQELGGRIVSVKSENVSLEWSSESN